MFLRKLYQFLFRGVFEMDIQTFQVLDLLNERT